MIRVKKSSRAVIGANPRELSNLRKHSAHSRLKRGAPDVGIIPVSGLENHGRAAGATTHKIHLTPTAYLDEAGKITGRGDSSYLRGSGVRSFLRGCAKRRRQNQR